MTDEKDTGSSTRLLKEFNVPTRMQRSSRSDNILNMPHHNIVREDSPVVEENEEIIYRQGDFPIPPNSIFYNLAAAEIREVDIERKESCCEKIMNIFRLR